MIRILVVEDDERVREAVCEVLGVNGYETTEAADGDQGLNLLETGQFDLAIIDIWMPGIDGLALLKKIRGRSSDMPVIIMSGGAANTTLEHAAAIADSHDAKSVLFKPFEDFELTEAVGKALKGAPPRMRDSTDRP